MTIDKKRFTIFGIFTAVFVILIIWKFFSVMVISEPYENSWRASTTIERGSIWDRNGEILAMSDQLYSVSASVKNIDNIERTALLLDPIVDIRASKLVEKLKSGSGFVWIRRKLSTSQSDEILKKIDEGLLPGINLTPEYGRTYPKRNIASHVLGYTNTDDLGISGMEKQYNNYLYPNPTTDDKDILYGNDLYLSIDINVQYMAEKLAKKAYKDNKADAVMILVMEAKTGDFLAVSSYPDFDPNNWQDYSSDERYARPFVFAYEPGSVFKVFSIASFLQADSISPSSTFFCNGYYERVFDNGEPVHINCLGIHGSVDPLHILKYSCNAGAAYASETISNNDFYFMLTQFGYGQTTAMDFPWESNGLLHDIENWSLRTKQTISFGQEILVSAVQVVTAATVFANDGQLLEPHIVKKIVNPESQVLVQNRRKVVAEVMTLAKVNEILDYMTVATNKRARIEGVSVASKTGTAEAIDPDTGTYSEDRVVSSCLALFPSEDPEVIVYVVIDYPKGKDIYGGIIAAPVVGALGEELVGYLGIPRKNEKILLHSGTVHLKKPTEIVVNDTLPNLIGLSKKEIGKLFLDDRIELHVFGDGWVISQNPAPGTPIGDEIVVELVLE